MSWLRSFRPISPFRMKVKLHKRLLSLIRMEMRGAQGIGLASLPKQPSHGYCSCRPNMKDLQHMRPLSHLYSSNKADVILSGIYQHNLNFVCCRNYSSGLVLPTVASNVRFYSEMKKDTPNTNDSTGERPDDGMENMQNDPWVKSLLADMKKDFDLRDGQSSQSTSVGNSESKEDDENKELSAKENPSEEEYEYDYRFADDDIEEFGYYEEADIDNTRPDKQLPISLNRSKSGVFELEEVVALVEHLGAENTVSVPIPAEANYCDHMVVATAKSRRHLHAMNEELLWVHKRKKWRKDPVLHIEGYAKGSDWCAMDMGNVVLHLFLTEELRAYYDIESLWLLGPDNDPKCLQENQENHQDSFALSAEDLFWLESTGGKEDPSPNKTDG